MNSAKILGRIDPGGPPMKTVSAKNRVSYYIRYTLLFIVTALVIYAPFLVMKKSFVWEHDSYTQHLKAMVYISRWYRQTLKALLHGNFKAISTYSFSIDNKALDFRLPCLK